MVEPTAGDEKGKIDRVLSVVLLSLIVISLLPKAMGYTGGGWVANVPPETTLISPFDADEISTGTPTLVWYSIDHNGDGMKYKVYVHRDRTLVENFDESALAVGVLVQNLYLSPGEFHSWFKVTGLEDKTTHFWTVIPTDSNNATGNCSSGIWTFVTNTGLSKYPPVSAFVMSKEITYEGDVVEFNASLSMDIDGQITSWWWDFGEDGWEEGRERASHPYKDNGIYWVRLTVVDNDGLEDTWEMRISVLNLPPVAMACCNQTVEVRMPIELTAADSFDMGSADASSLKYSWDFGDGKTASEKRVVHTYSKSDTYLVRLNVSDKDGGYDVTTIVIKVIDLPLVENAVVLFVLGPILAIGLCVLFWLLPPPKESSRRVSEWWEKRFEGLVKDEGAEIERGKNENDSET